MSELFIPSHSGTQNEDMCQCTLGSGLIEIQSQPIQNSSTLQIVDAVWLGTCAFTVDIVHEET